MSVLQNQTSTEPVALSALRNATKKCPDTAAQREHLTDLRRMSIALLPYSHPFKQLLICK